jgi:hypothetical protein
MDLAKLVSAIKSKLTMGMVARNSNISNQETLAQDGMEILLMAYGESEVSTIKQIRTTTIRTSLNLKVTERN